MIDKVRTFGTYSRLLSYPDDHYIQLAELLYVIVQNDLPEAARCVSKFGQFVETCNTTELEEAYTRTFDVNPSCALEVGWHLFGEDYVRGQFLVRMREELAKYEIPESAELPDHMTHVLAAIALMPEDEAKRFTHACVFPALAKMRKSLDENESPYRYLIESLQLILEHLYGVCEPWSDDDVIRTHDADAHPGQNGPRPPGMGDPLREFPMPCGPRDGDVELVPLQMEFSMPSSQTNHSSDPDASSDRVTYRSNEIGSEGRPL